MANVHVTVNRVSHKWPDGTYMPVLDSAPLVAESITSSGTADESTDAVPATARACVWNVEATGAVYVTFGPSPTAVVGEGHYVPADSPRQYAAQPGDKISVIDAS